MLAADVDLLSASAHKFYGPKGMRIVSDRKWQSPYSAKPEIVGGGQQSNLRSGTLQPTGIVALATALKLVTGLARQRNATDC